MSNLNKLITTKNQNSFHKQLNELIDAKNNSFSVTKSRNNNGRVIMAIRLYPSKGSTNYRRNVVFNLEFQLFKKEFIELLHKNRMKFDCHHHSNILFFIFPLDSQDIVSIYELTSLTKQLVSEINLNPLKLHIPCLNFAISLDLDAISFFDGNNLTQFWLYDFIDRTQILVKHANTDIYPSLLITYNFYQCLDSVLQNDFPKAYYINHIACHGKQI
ncbi:MAG: hypothetical protein Q4D21_05375 [Phascolarctobacterium sp.]|nr:hypothetical protein [Phascolarctobacterium sp.]